MSVNFVISQESSHDWNLIEFVMNTNEKAKDQVKGNVSVNGINMGDSFMDYMNIGVKNMDGKSMDRRSMIVEPWVVDAWAVEAWHYTYW